MNTCDLGIYLQALNIVCFTNMLLSFVQASWELPGTRVRVEAPSGMDCWR